MKEKAVGLNTYLCLFLIKRLQLDIGNPQGSTKVVRPEPHLTIVYNLQQVVGPPCRGLTHAPVPVDGRHSGNFCLDWPSCLQSNDPAHSQFHSHKFDNPE